MIEFRLKRVENGDIDFDDSFLENINDGDNIIEKTFLVLQTRTITRDGFAGDWQNVSIVDGD